MHNLNLTPHLALSDADSQDGVLLTYGLLGCVFSSARSLDLFQTGTSWLHAMTAALVHGAQIIIDIIIA